MRKLDKNPDITQKAALSGIFYWQIAKRMGIADTTFSRWLRKELDAQTKAQVLSIIKELAKEVS